MTSVRARAWDALVLVLVLGILLDVLTTDQDVPLELRVPVALAMTVPLIWGQRSPLPVAAVVLGAWLVQSFAGDWQLQPQSELLPVCVVFWCLGAYVVGRKAWWALGVALIGLFVHEPGDVVVLGPLMVGVFAAGRLMQSRERLAQELHEQRAQAERYAVAEERARIARELHDVVGHSIALMTVQAGAERLSLGDTQPETSRVLNQIEVTGRQTLQEMRRLLGILRAPDEMVDLTPQPGLDQVGVLVDRMRRAGLTIDVEIDAGDRLPKGVDISAYRIVQEALTNVLKYAESGRARLRIAHDQETIEIEVTDDGPARPAPTNEQGHGLTGMRERVALYGGSLEVGPSAEGGWRLIARLPKEPGR